MHGGVDVMNIKTLLRHVCVVPAAELKYITIYSIALTDHE